MESWEGWGSLRLTLFLTLTLTLFLTLTLTLFLTLTLTLFFRNSQTNGKSVRKTGKSLRKLEKLYSTYLSIRPCDR